MTHEGHYGFIKANYMIWRFIWQLSVLRTPDERGRSEQGTVLNCVLP